MHGKFRAFLKKRAHLLTFVGALIVFFTFVTKEGIVEHWKDTVSAVDTAEYRFRTSSISMEILGHVFGNANTLERIENKVNGQGDLNHARLEEEHINLGRNYEQLMLASDLLKKLPANSQDSDRLSQLLAESNQFNDAINAAAERLEGAGAGPPDPVRTTTEIMPLTLRGMAFEKSAADFVHAVRERAVEERDKDERYLKYATWASYVLYTLGWGLGLFAKLYGVEGVGAGE
jgi:hypothetical protein